MIKFVKNLTRPIRNYFRLNNKYTRYFYGKYFGLHNLDQKLETYMPHKNGYFIELGANDGITQSNTKYFELFKDWTGVLIEPYMPNVEKCKRYRKSTTKVFHAACVSPGYPGKEVKLLFSNLMTVELEPTGDILDTLSHAREGARFLGEGEFIHEFKAPARTLTDILNQAEAPTKVDLLSLDVEGNELAVLKGVDFQKYQIEFICVETRSEQKVTEFLSEMGYSTLDHLSSHDVLYSRKN